jgi:hypothetical protein
MKPEDLPPEVLESFLEASFSQSVNEVAREKIKEFIYINEWQGRYIASTLQKKLDFDPVRVHFFEKENIKEDEYGTKVLHGRAYHKSRAIVLWKTGHEIINLLHELAHLMPGGNGHSLKWVDNFRTLVDTYNTMF